MFLNNHANGLSEEQMLDRIKSARAETESPEPTEADQAETLHKQAEEQVAEESTEAEEVVSEESEELEVSQTEETLEDEDPIYLIGDKEISLSQLNELEQGQLRQSDYTRKTQELSDQRKELESKSAKISELTDNLSSKISQLDTMINSEVESVNWDELADLDPSEFLKKKSAIEKKQAALKEAQAEQAKLLQERATEEFKVLSSKMPAWVGDEGQDVRKADSDRALKYLGSIGFTNQETAGIVDHRFYLMAINAAKYEELQKKAPSVKKKVTQAPKVTPATKTAKKAVPKLQEAKQKLRKSGSERDAFEALRQMYRGQ